MDVTRRDVLAGGLALAATAAMGVPTRAATKKSWYAGTGIDNGVSWKRTNFDVIDPVWHKQIVKYFSAEPAGTVVVDTQHHFLYLIIENQTAVRYGVGVGKEGFKWYGRANVARKALWPRWTPPPEMHERKPGLPQFIDGGAPDNPLGPRALYLHRDGADTGYRFHGTVEPWSIGKDVSSGCIRMFNEDVMDLYQRCPVGTAVQVLPHIADNAPKKS